MRHKVHQFPQTSTRFSTLQLLGKAPNSAILNISLILEIPLDFCLVTDPAVFQEISGPVNTSGLSLGNFAKYSTQNQKQRGNGKSIEPFQLSPVKDNPNGRQSGKHSGPHTEKQVKKFKEGFYLRDKGPLLPFLYQLFHVKRVRNSIKPKIQTNPKKNRSPKPICQAIQNFHNGGKYRK